MVSRGWPISRSAKRTAERSNDFGQVVSEGIARGAQILEGCCLVDGENGSKKEDKGAGWWADCMTEERKLRERAGRKWRLESKRRRRTQGFIRKRREEMRM